MEARNLMEEDCNRLEETMQEIKKTNPAATHRFFQQNEQDRYECEVHMKRLEDKVDALTNKLENIFGNAVLINGMWKCL